MKNVSGSLLNLASHIKRIKELNKLNEFSGNQKFSNYFRGIEVINSFENAYMLSEIWRWSLRSSPLPVKIFYEGLEMKGLKENTKAMSNFAIYLLIVAK